MDQPLINDQFLLERYEGKGGWTYAALPGIVWHKKSPFGQLRVCGSIDGVSIKGYHLMPMGKGKLFFPVKAEIRKRIGKEAGNKVHIILYPDELPTPVPEELKLCLSMEPGAYDTFLSYTDSQQKAFIDWIYAAKKEDTRATRILKTINKLLQHKRLYDP
jgi:hypothetical protein